MTNPLENQNRGMFLFRRFTKGNYRRAVARFDFGWVVPRDSDYFWHMHDYYQKMTILEIMGKEARRECCS